jgi:hypothetical protein
MERATRLGRRNIELEKLKFNRGDAKRWKERLPGRAPPGSNLEPAEIKSGTGRNPINEEVQG